MLKVLCMAIERGKASLYAFVPIFAKILHCAIFFQSNFFDGLVVVMLCGKHHTMSPEYRFS